MNRNLSKLLVPINTLSAAEVSKPTEKDIAVLEGVDREIGEPIEELLNLAEATRFRIRAGGSPLCNMTTFMRLGYGSVPDVQAAMLDIDNLKLEHRRRIDLITPLFQSKDFIEIEDGLKSEASLARRLAQVEVGRSDDIPDVSRMRIVCKNLRALERAQLLVEARLPNQGLLQVTRKNRYGDRMGRVEDCDGQLLYMAGFGLIDPYRAISSGWVVNDDQAGVLGHIPTELMFATERATACSRLNQPYRELSQRLSWPDEEAREWMLALMHKANILDYLEYLEESPK